MGVATFSVVAAEDFSYVIHETRDDALRCAVLADAAIYTATIVAFANEAMKRRTAAMSIQSAPCDESSQLTQMLPG